MFIVLVVEVKLAIGFEDVRVETVESTGIVEKVKAIVDKVVVELVTVEVVVLVKDTVVVFDVSKRVPLDVVSETGELVFCIV